MTVTEALQLARSQGVEVTLDGDDLVLKTEAAPPPRLLAILGRGEWDIVAVLRQREDESAVRSFGGSPTTSLHRHPVSALIAATASEQTTPSYGCSPETKGARSTEIVTRRRLGCSGPSRSLRVCTDRRDRAATPEAGSRQPL